jgi:hypothetical protein
VCSARQARRRCCPQTASVTARRPHSRSG